MQYINLRISGIVCQIVMNKSHRAACRRTNLIVRQGCKCLKFERCPTAPSAGSRLLLQLFGSTGRAWVRNRRLDLQPLPEEYQDSMNMSAWKAHSYISSCSRWGKACCLRFVPSASKPASALRGTKRALVYARDHSVEQSLEQIATWNSATMLSNDLLRIAASMAQNKNK